jgi:LPPG:FO 2-phospho-L-lactate transferase
MLVLLAGGTGGAKLARGLARVLPSERLVVIANTGDDFYRMGLRICPDLDSILYHLAGIHDAAAGWGIGGDTFTCLGQLATLGEETWFQLGDKDLATHLLRHRLLAEGSTLTEVTVELGRRLAIGCRVLPMCDGYSPTFLDTDQGRLHMQEYFVREACRPVVTGVSYNSSGQAAMTSAVAEILAGADHIVIGPSNPFLSILPILEVTGFRAALQQRRPTVTAVSPLVGGRALKGPSARMLTQLGYDASVMGIARVYGSQIQRIMIDSEDREAAQTLRTQGLEVVVTDTIMRSESAEMALASRLADFP